jgi:hypothetical protein
MLVEKMRGLCSSNCAFLSEPFFQAGFISGMALILLIALVVWLLVCKRRKLVALNVQEEGGLFVLSTAALKTFLKRIVLEFSKAELKDMRICKKQDGIMLTLFLQVYPDTDVIALRSRLRERILADAASKLGVAEQIQGINIEISKMRDDVNVPVIPIEEKANNETTKNEKKAADIVLPPLK